MITLEKLVANLKIEKIDEVLAGDFTWTTRGGTSGEPGDTFTTDTSTKKKQGGYQNLFLHP